jgi:putative transcriptional regulator
VTQKLKNRLREVRQQGEGMTQQALADLVGVSRQSIIAIESGRYSPSLELAIKIAEVFDCEIRELFWLEK